jgi:SPP1 gp7 family putative phage head morphogenesis protein
VPVGAKWLSSLALHLRSPDVGEAMARWTADLNADAEFPQLVYQAGFQSFLGGQLFVRAIELAGEPGALTLSATRDAASDAFLAMPFDEAIAFFRAKGVMSEAEFDALRDRYRAGGFVARQLASQRMEQVAHDLITRLLEQGMTLDEVRRQLRDQNSDEAAALGISPASPSYLDTVIRTNVSSSYGHGRWEAMNDPDVVALRPYCQYRTAGDSRVRHNHAALNGLVFRMGSDEAAYYAPPLGFNCRCTLVTLSERQLAARSLTVQDGRVPGVDPDEGWAGAPRALTQADAP